MRSPGCKQVRFFKRDGVHHCAVPAFAIDDLSNAGPDGSKYKW